MEKFYYDKYDIMERYGVGETKAYQILRAIREYFGGGKLSPGRVLKTELIQWENDVFGTMKGIEAGEDER